jgi:hypothetical protein
VPRQVHEKGELSRGQIELPTGERRAAIETVERQRPDPERRRVRATPGERPRPRQELAEIEWLPDVVVGAGVEPGDALAHLATRREHEDRHREAARAHFAADREPVHLREHPVEDHQVVRHALELLDPGGAVPHLIDGVTLLDQRSNEERAELPVVLHDEDSHLSQERIQRAASSR